MKGLRNCSLEPYGGALQLSGKALNHRSTAVTVFCSHDQQLRAKSLVGAARQGGQKCDSGLTSRADWCIVKMAVPGGEVTIAERNNKPYFVALDGGAQTPILFDPCERNKIKILLRSRAGYVIM